MRMPDPEHDIEAIIHEGAKQGAKQARVKLTDRRLLIIFILVILVGIIAGDADARYRSNENKTGLGREFCDQQAAFKSLPVNIHTPRNSDETIRRLVTSVQRIQRSGADLYVKFDCPAKR